MQTWGNQELEKPQTPEPLLGHPHLYKVPVHIRLTAFGGGAESRASGYLWIQDVCVVLD